MIIAIFVVEDVVFAQTEIKGEFAHCFLYKPQKTQR
jgi:hypothetical protein